MLLRYFFYDKLAHASYLVGCQATGDGIVVDPGRDIEPYLAAAEDEDLRIVAVTETHIHADFVSGARELAARTGAKLYLSAGGGPEWQYEYQQAYPHEMVKDGDTFFIGNLRFEVMHTPGHTPEHISLLVTDTKGADRPMGLFSGDFVFVGDVGRPDLLEKAARVANTAELGARQMFQSLQRFRQLPDYIQVWPGHGAGSACGKMLGAVPSSTVGYEKLFSWAFQEEDEALFVRQLLDGQPEPPRYFGVMKRVNKAGPTLLKDVTRPAWLPFERLAQALAEGALVVDTRPMAAFAASHISGTLNLPYNYDFPNWAGWLIPYDRPFYLIADSRWIEEVQRDLYYVGLDQAAGYFEAGMVDQWAAENEMESYRVARSAELADKILRGEVTLVDIRKQSEWDEGHIPGAVHLMLGYLEEEAGKLPANRPVVVQCRTGKRSAIGASVLQKWGMADVVNMMGGYRDWVAAGLPVENGQ
jgi:hydroxyacylglutathione hydrolase